MRLTFNQKLIWGFAIIIVLIIGTSTATFILTQLLMDSVHHSMERSAQMEAAMEVKFLSLKQYQLQADMIINNDLSILAEFEEVEEHRSQAATVLQEGMDTPEELAWVAQMAEADEEFDRLLTEELVPLLEAGAVIEEIREVDAKSDAALTLIIDALDSIDISLEAEIDVAEERQDRLAWLNELVTIVAGAFAILAAVLISAGLVLGIRRQISQMTTAMAEVAHGDMRVRVITDPSRVNPRDELTQISLAFDGLVDSLAQILARINDVAANVASNSEELSASAEETSRSVQQVAQTMQDVARGSQDTTARVAESRENLRQNAQAIEGIAREIEEIAGVATAAAKQGEHGRHSADEAAATINNAATSVQDTAVVVRALGEKTEQIGQFIGIITSIADQTNLLALNAAIEAARAGEAGRGFAVVAEEVRKLAEESNEAAGSITHLVQGIAGEMQTALQAMQRSDEEVDAGAETVRETSKLLQEIVAGIQSVNEKVQNVSAAAEEINASTTEVLESIDQVATAAETGSVASEEVSSATEEQTATMEEIGTNSGILAKMAQELQEMVSQFRI